MRITLVVASAYAGVVLAAPAVESANRAESQQQWPSFGNLFDDDDDFPFARGGLPPWMKKGRPDNKPSFFSNSPNSQRSSFGSSAGPSNPFSWAGFGSGSSYGAERAQPSASSPLSSGGLGGLFGGLFGGSGGSRGNSRGGNSNKQPTSPNPFGGFAGFAPSQPETSRPEIPRPRPEVPQPRPEIAASEEASEEADSREMPRVPTLGAAPAVPAASPQPKFSSSGAGPGPVPKASKGLPKGANKPPAAVGPEIEGDMIPGDVSVRKHDLWQPKVAEPFQIILSGHPDVSVKVAPDFVNIFDLDLFNTPASTIKYLRDQGKKVICYFSAGSSEDWRPDYKKFSKSEMGNKVAKDDAGKSYWEGERWLNIKNPNPNSPNLPNVWKIMQTRIKLAADKGCNAIDPDNTGM
jgi:glycosyl hydrolase family 114